MLTKYILHIDGADYELQPDDLKNWDRIECAYKRADFDGVVRSFSSQFEFVNHARDLLFESYQQNGLNAEASITVLTITDRWTYEERFSCPLDFSTITWENRVLKINSIDNSIAALIKANKSTKYEFAIGRDIKVNSTFRFDRVPMQESLTYEFTQGEQYDDCADIQVTIRNGEHPFIGNVGSELSINLALDWNDDQTEAADSYLFKAIKDVFVTLDFDLSWRQDYGDGGTNIGVHVIRNGVDVPEAVTGAVMANNLATMNSVKPVTDCPTVDRLEEKYPAASNLGLLALVNGSVWQVAFNDEGYFWENTGKTPEIYFTKAQAGKRYLNLRAGDIVYISATIATVGQEKAEFRIVRNKFMFSWMIRGNQADIPALTPLNVATTLLSRIAGTHTVPRVVISDYDPRMKSTWLLAAESARDISGAKLYTSLDEFCGWMSAVFGYVYFIDSSSATPVIKFMHRSELFSDAATIRHIDSCRDLQYGVDAGAIYSQVTVGYDKKDYNSINGRDEFNFNNTYTTGCRVSDKTLTLTSKYRADCYGIEFAVQKRDKDTTDATSDKDVFFVLCKIENGRLVPDRSAKITNAISDAVFNGAFSPMACVRANAGIIGLQGNITLAFASSTGNSEIRINDEPMTADIYIDSQMATCGSVEFTTDDVDDVTDTNALIEVIDDGVVYRGYLKEVSLKYARTEAARYKLIIKSIES